MTTPKNRSSRPNSIAWLVSCEHGGNEVPAAYAEVFGYGKSRAWLESHRGYDPGALEAARVFANFLSVDLIASMTTRLLVDLNRSIDHSAVFSKFTAGLKKVQRDRIVAQFYEPYRNQVINHVASLIADGRVPIHLSIHTFTPRFRGEWRPIDVGILFDPASSQENAFCCDWIKRLELAYPRLRVRANQPYAGCDDGLTTFLRGRFAGQPYLGIEIEINHRYWKRSAKSQSNIVESLLSTLPDAKRLSLFGSFDATQE